MPDELVNKADEHPDTLARGVGRGTLAALALLVAAAAASGCASLGSGGAYTPGTPVSLRAERELVSGYEQVRLQWQAPNARHCRAHGAWSGSRPVTGSQSIGPVEEPRAYHLYCAGDAGTGSASLTVVPRASQASIAGQVDSSRVVRDPRQVVYVFAGMRSLDSVGGSDLEPMLEVSLQQAVGGCSWFYATPELEPGDYTIALATPTRHAWFGTDEVRLSTSVVLNLGDAPLRHDFSARRVLKVGPDRELTMPSAAAAMARDGDVVEIDPGEYSGDTALWRAAGLTVRGAGGYAHLRAAGQAFDNKGIWVVQGDGFRVEAIEFSGARSSYRNGAGIRQEANDLSVCNGYFHDNENGILGGGGDVLIEYSEFARNGHGDGYSHNMYIAHTDTFTLRYSYVHHARIGHNVKSRARENRILYNRIVDERAGNSSYLVDIPNGGLAYVIGNVMHQSVFTDNTALIAYGAEGSYVGPPHALFVVNNTLVNDLDNGRFVHNFDSSAEALIVNNLMVGSGVALQGPGELDGNVRTLQPRFVDRDAFDYRLRHHSPARDAGVVPGSGVGQELAPRHEYQHSASSRQRRVDDVLDVGAYEFSP